MKVISGEDVDQAVNQSVNKALIGGAYGLVAGVAIAAVANKFSPWYRRLTPALKGFSVLTPVIAGMMIWGEEELLAIERANHTQHHNEIMKKKIEEFKRLEAESVKKD